MLNYLVFIDCNLKTSVNFSEIITMSDHASKIECKQILINDVKTQNLLVFRLPLSKNGPFGTIQTTITTTASFQILILFAYPAAMGGPERLTLSDCANLSSTYP